MLGCGLFFIFVFVGYFIHNLPTNPFFSFNFIITYAFSSFFLSFFCLVFMYFKDINTKEKKTKSNNDYN